MKRKVVSYIRVSTEEQARHGYSIPAQRQVLEDYARGHDLQIVEEFVESESAYRPGRPEYSRMLKLLKRHRDVTGVLCYKIDRIARNLSDYSALAEMSGVNIISATEALPENATGQLIGTVQAAFSRFYSDQLSERVSLGLETKARKGEWPSGAPTGYLNDPLHRGILPDPQMGPIIQEVFELYARGDVSLREAVGWARKRGLRTRSGGALSKGPLYKLLTNPVYYGSFRWKGVLYEGSHAPLISKALFDRVQERLRGKSSPRGEHQFPYRGLLQCGYCGCGITASVAKRRYVYYHCTHGRGNCPQPYVRQDRMGERLLPLVQKIHMSRELVERLLERIRTGNERLQEERARRLRALRTEEKAIRNRRDAAYVDKLDGKLSEARWLEFERTWSEKAALISERIEELGAESEPREDEARAAFELLEQAPELYQRQSDEERARLLRRLLSNCIITSENVVPIYKEPFAAVAHGMQTGDWLGREDSNLRSRLQRPLPYHLSLIHI